MLVIKAPPLTFESGGEGHGELGGTGIVLGAIDSLSRLSSLLFKDEVEELRGALFRAKCPASEDVDALG
jgi:hypothetical protein